MATFAHIGPAWSPSLTYATERAEVGTLTRRLSAISQAHQLAGLDSPTAHIAVRKQMAGIRRAKGTAQQGKRPVTIADLGRMLAGLSADRPREARDRALVLVGFAAALRRSELVALDIEDLERGREELVLTLRHSKTDQEGQGRRIGVPHGAAPGTCPVRAVEEWVKRLGAEAGPVFRRISRDGAIGGRLSAPSVALIVKRLAARASLDAGEFAGHSLRASGRSPVTPPRAREGVEVDTVFRAGVVRDLIYELASGAEIDQRAPRIFGDAIR